MSIRSILVNLDVDSFSPTLVRCAADLAQRFGAELTAVAAAEPTSAMVGVDGATASAIWYAQERADIEGKLKALETDFRAQVPAGIVTHWRAFIDSPNRAVVASARCADLIIAGTRLDTSTYTRGLDLGELVLNAGRPVIAVGAGIDRIAAENILVGWKDTREARRALLDALPLLEAANKVVLATVSEGDRDLERLSLNEALGWLKLHGVKAEGDIYPVSSGSGGTLEEIAAALGADLIVTGGYGHSRFREWLFGGVTRDLLASQSRNRFLSN